MISSAVQTSINTKPVQQSMERKTFRSVAHAAATIRKEAIASVEYSREVRSYLWKTRKGKRKRVPYYEPSQPGKPVRGHKSPGYFRQAIAFGVERDNASIGPQASRVGQGMRIHEHGGVRNGIQYPQRSVMQPALLKNLDRFARSFGSDIT